METRALDRRTEIDVAKGFALFLVVFAHVLDRDSIWAYWIFMFHMPVFFFLSGMTFRPEKYVDFLLWAAGGAVCRSDMVFDGAVYGRAFCISVVSDLGAETALGPLL